MQNIIGLKDLRENVATYAKAVAKGKSFIVVKQSKPLFKISPFNNTEEWEEVVDFTKVKKGGVNIKEILKRI